VKQAPCDPNAPVRIQASGSARDRRGHNGLGRLRRHLGGQRRDGPGGRGVPDGNRLHDRLGGDSMTRQPITAGWSLPDRAMASRSRLQHGTLER
jgi:hypothetical protein